MVDMPAAVSIASDQIEENNYGWKGFFHSLKMRPFATSNWRIFCSSFSNTFVDIPMDDVWIHSFRFSTCDQKWIRQNDWIFSSSDSK